MKWLFLLLLFVGSAFAAEPFTPSAAGTVTVSVTSASAATVLHTSVAQAKQVEIQNLGPQTVFVEFGTSSATAAVASGYPILAGQSKVISINPSVTHIAAITGSSTSTLYVTVGNGE